MNNIQRSGSGHPSPPRHVSPHVVEAAVGRVSVPNVLSAERGHVSPHLSVSVEAGRGHQSASSPDHYCYRTVTILLHLLSPCLSLVTPTLLRWWAGHDTTDGTQLISPHRTQTGRNIPFLLHLPPISKYSCTLLVSEWCLVAARCCVVCCCIMRHWSGNIIG